MGLQNSASERAGNKQYHYPSTLRTALFPECCSGCFVPAPHLRRIDERAFLTSARRGLAVSPVPKDASRSRLRSFWLCIHGSRFDALMRDAGLSPPAPETDVELIAIRTLLNYATHIADRMLLLQACPSLRDMVIAIAALEAISPHHRNTQNFDSPTSASLYLNQFTISSIAEMEARADLLKLASELEIRGFPNQKRRPYFVTDAANCILREQSSQRDAPTVGPNWTSRFLKRHGYFKSAKRLQAERQVSENLTRVNQYFQHLRQVIQDNGIPPEDIWNMDETGFRIGVGKDQLIVTKRRRAHYFGIPENRNPLLRSKLSRRMGRLFRLLILAGQMHMASWYQIPELDPDTVIRPTPTGYSNDVISLEWLQHFDKHSEKSSRSSKRLLILDGHGSHHTRQFIEYCDNHNIIPFGMPPNLTHALQPLDVVVFQPLKHYHAKALDVMVRDGLVNITKLEFLSCIQQVRLHAFKESTIRSAFRKTGIFPFNPQVVLQCLEARQATTPTPPPNSGPHSSPFETPLTLRQINKVADKLDLVLEDDKSLDPDFLTISVDLFEDRYLWRLSSCRLKGLGTNKMAERIQKQRKAMKNIQLQSGGVLSVAQGREMIAKARKVVEDAEKKAHNARKRWFEEAAKRHANGGFRKVRTSGTILGRGVEILGIPVVWGYWRWELANSK
ncbi:DDE superfamily endonuclease [Hirsutella rhossiliensis]